MTPTQWTWFFIVSQWYIFVTVPPHQLILYDKSGRDVSGVVGPLEEGNELVLICEVRGGKDLNGDLDLEKKPYNLYI